MSKKIAFYAMLTVLPALLIGTNANARTVIGEFNLIPGPQGPKGEAGTGIDYQGEVNDCDELHEHDLDPKGNAWFNRSDNLLYIATGTGFPTCEGGGVPFRGIDGCSPVITEVNQYGCYTITDQTPNGSGTCSTEGHTPRTVCSACPEVTEYIKSDANGTANEEGTCNTSIIYYGVRNGTGACGKGNIKSQATNCSGTNGCGVTVTTASKVENEVEIGKTMTVTDTCTNDTIDTFDILHGETGQNGDSCTVNNVASDGNSKTVTFKCGTQTSDVVVPTGCTPTYAKTYINRTNGETTYNNAERSDNTIGERITLSGCTAEPVYMDSYDGTDGVDGAPACTAEYSAVNSETGCYTITEKTVQNGNCSTNGHTQKMVCPECPEVIENVQSDASGAESAQGSCFTSHVYKGARDSNTHKCIKGVEKTSAKKTVCNGTPGAGITYKWQEDSCQKIVEQHESTAEVGDAYFSREDHLLYIAYRDEATNTVKFNCDDGVPFQGNQGDPGETPVVGVIEQAGKVYLTTQVGNEAEVIHTNVDLKGPQGPGICPTNQHVAVQRQDNTDKYDIVCTDD